MTDYRFPTRIKKIEKVRGPEIDLELMEEDLERGEIMGRYAASFAEWVVALALWYLKLKFVYKKGIRDTRYYVDFYIEASPLWVMLDVRQFSETTETSSQRFRKKIIESIMKRPLHTVWDYQVSTYEEAIHQVRKYVF